MSHKCSRDECPPTNASGPKKKCIKCNNVCFLKCFDFDKFTDNETIKLILPNGAKLIMETAQMTFVCPACDTTGVVLQQQNAANRSSPKRTTIASINGDLNEIKNEILSKLNEVKKISNETNNLVKSMNTTTQKTSTNRTSSMMNKTPRKPLFSTMLKASSTTTESTSTPQMNKRKRDQLVMIENKTSQTVSTAKVPSPKIGKKAIHIGRPLEVKLPVQKKT